MNTQVTRGRGHPRETDTGMATEWAKSRDAPGAAVEETPLHQAAQRSDEQIRHRGVALLAWIALGLWRGQPFQDCPDGCRLLRSAIRRASPGSSHHPRCRATRRSPRPAPSSSGYAPGDPRLDVGHHLDKTGTLTLNQMTAVEMAVAAGASPSRARYHGRADQRVDGDSDVDLDRYMFRWRSAPTRWPRRVPRRRPDRGRAGRPGVEGGSTRSSPGSAIHGSPEVPFDAAYKLMATSSLQTTPAGTWSDVL